MWQQSAKPLILLGFEATPVNKGDSFVLHQPSSNAPDVLWLAVSTNTNDPMPRDSL